MAAKSRPSPFYDLNRICFKAICCVERTHPRLAGGDIMPVTTGMKPHGFYNQHSAPQLQSITAVLPWLLEAISSINFSDAKGPVLVADFGASEGRNSVAAMRQVVPAIRARTERPIQVILSDLATSDFNQLFVNLMPGGQSAFAEPDVYSAAVGGSMFDQLLPGGTVTIATTYNAIGFLSRKPPVDLPNYILPMGPSRPRAGIGVSSEVRQAYAAQAAEDLRNFYRARAASMVRGGKLLVASFGVGEQHRCCDGIYDLLNDALLDLVEEGRISQADHERLVFPIYFRSVAELIAPIHGSSRDPSYPFKLERAESMEVPVPFNEEFESSKDLETYASEHTGFLRAFSEPIVRLCFASLHDLEDVIERLYQRVRSRLIERREDYVFRYVQVAALLTHQ
jgi:gibberellin A4 carboxyl methyltransferase